MKNIYSKLFLLVAALLSTTMANENVKAVSKSNNQLTNKLYSQIAKPSENLIFSPLSIDTILALLAQGAEGKSDEALRSVLELPTKALSAEGFQDVMGALNNMPDIILNIANQIYVKDGYTLKQSFKDVATKSFYSGASNIDFTKNVEAAAEINKWVEDKTNNKIKDLISPGDLDALTRLVLVNAIYFKGEWKEKFDEKLTRTEKFYLTKTDTVNCSMMHKTAKYNFKDDTTLDAKVLQIPYKNPNVSMVVVLPNTIDGIGALETKLKDYDLSTLTQGMYNQEVIVSLPRFKIESTIPLNDPLTNIGLGNIFSSDANLGGLLDSPEELMVSKAIQKAFIEVNEEGAEAAAATGVIMMVRCMPMMVAKPEFLADHPFTFYLVDDKNNALFAGKVSDAEL